MELPVDKDDRALFNAATIVTLGNPVTCLLSTTFLFCTAAAAAFVSSLLPAISSTLPAKE
jgi:hypothetical protein